MTVSYDEDEWAEVDEMMRHLPLQEIEPLVEMSLFTMRNRCKKKGITPVHRGKVGGMKRKEVRELMEGWKR